MERKGGRPRRSEVDAEAQIFYQQLGKNLREIRKKMTLSQEEISAKIDADSSTWARWESGKRGMMVYSLKRISEALHISADEILGLELRNSRDIIGIKLTSDELMQVESVLRNTLALIEEAKNKQQDGFGLWKK